MHPGNHNMRLIFARNARNRNNESRIMQPRRKLTKIERIETKPVENTLKICTTTLTKTNLSRCSRQKIPAKIQRRKFNLQNTFFLSSTKFTYCTNQKPIFVLHRRYYNNFFTAFNSLVPLLPTTSFSSCTLSVHQRIAQNTFRPSGFP